MEVNWEGGNAIADALLHRSTTEDFYKAKVDLEWATEKRGGSANLDMIAAAAGLFWDRSKIKDYVNAWLRFFEQEKRTFQRSEPWSVIYSGWQVISVLFVRWTAALLGESNLHHEATQWLRNWWALCALADTQLGSEPHVALAGARSSGIPFNHYYGIRTLWAEALGFSVIPRGVEHGQWRESIDKWFDIAAVKLLDDIRETAADFTYMSNKGDWVSIFNASPKYGMRAGGNILITNGGVVSWQDHDINGNTAGVIAIKGEYGRFHSLPPDGGPYFRMKHSKATCTLNGNILTYSSPYSELGTHTMTLPVGDKQFQLRIDEDGWHLVYPKKEEPKPEDPQVPPTRPSKPKKKSFWTKLKDFFRKVF